MIIKSISAENFGKFDRYSVNLDDSINVFYGDNEAGKTTLYEIISILLFAPSNDAEMAESNKLIKTDEKYARVYAIINFDGREISVAREIYVNDTNLSIADQDNVSSLGNVNVPFIGDLTKDMYESFHTIDYYNMATITHNVWQQIVKVIEESHGAARVTPDYSTPEEEEIVKKKSSFEEQIASKEEEKKELEAKLKNAQKMQKRMIKNQDKIDDLLNDLEDVENNIELESSYLKEANKMNQIRSTIKKTQDLTLELEKYKNLEPWMPELRKYYERLKLYTENKANGIENPLDMFDDLEGRDTKQENETVAKEENIEPEKVDVKEEAEPVEELVEEPVQEEPEEPVEEQVEVKAEEPVVEDKEPQEDKFDYSKITLPSEQDYELAKEKINKFIEESYLSYDYKSNSNADDPYADDEKEKDEPAYPSDAKKDTSKYTSAAVETLADVKPLEIRKPKDTQQTVDNAEDVGMTNRFGQRNPYTDNIFPDMKDVNYSGKKVPKARIDNDDDDDKYSLSSSNGLPTQTQKVSEKDMNNNKETSKEDEILQAEEFLNNVDMQEIIAASKQTVEVDEETEEEINKAQLRYKIIAKRVFDKDMDMDDLSKKLKKLDTNSIYKAIVKYKGLSQQQRRFENTNTDVSPGNKSTSKPSLVLGVLALFSLLLGLACFFIEPIADLYSDVEIMNKIYNTIMQLPLNNIVAGNLLAGGAFVLITILLTVAMILGNEEAGSVQVEPVDEVALDELKNSIRMAKREVIDSLGDFPIPPSYLENPNNTIITVINELRDAESAYSQLISESSMPNNENYKTLWRLSKKHLGEEEISEDLFENISKLRRKIQDHKEDKAEIDKKRRDAQIGINMLSGKTGHNNQNNNSFKTEKINSYSGINQVNENLYSGNDNDSFSLPQPSNTGMNSAPNQNVGESNAFGLPQANSGSVNSESNTPFAKQEDNPYKMQESQYNAPNDTGYPTGGNAMGSEPDLSYPTGGNAMGSEPDLSYPTGGNAMGSEPDLSYPTGGNAMGSEPDLSYPTGGNAIGSEPDLSYPTGGNAMGSEPDLSYPTGGNAMGTEPDLSYPGDNNSVGSQSNDFGIRGINKYTNDAPQQQESTDSNQFGIPGINKYTNDVPQQQQSANSNDFGIPGINKYTNDVPQQQESANSNDFGIPGINKYTNDAPQQQSANSNDFGIPGINKYTNDAPQQQQSADSNDFGIPGINKYTNDAPQQQQSANSNDFGIPGINKYTNDAPQQQQEKSYAYSGGLPGLDKFSNRGMQTEQNSSKPDINTDVKDDVDIPIVPVAANPVDTAAVTAGVTGAAISGGLPGLDKFSNRGEQIKTELPVKNDGFDIPGVHRYTGNEQVSDNTESIQTNLESIAEEKPLIINETTEEVKEAVEAKAEIAEELTDETVAEPIEEIPVIKEVKKDKREKEYDKLLEILGDDPESTIRDVEVIARELHMEIIKRDEAMGELLKLNDAAVRLSTLSSNKWPYKQKAVDASEERIDYLEADKLKLKRHLEMLESKIDKVDYEDTPQAISDRLKVVGEEIEQLKLENDKHAIAEELIEKRKLLDMSSNTDRSHIIDDTSVYMKELTLGKYVQVKINDDQSGLSICNKDGEWFDTTKDRLSQATREQLYLALRISIADLFDEKSIIFPMFFDEALITWDKRRMKAVMKLLSKMSIHRQVIIFTCHDWLKDMISEYLIGAKIILM